MKRTPHYLGGFLEIASLILLWMLSWPGASALAVYTRNAFQESIWSRRSDLEGKVGLNPLLQVTVNHKAYCGSMALTYNISAASFTFDPASRQCYIYSVQSPPIGSDLPGAVTYFRKVTSCPEGWKSMEGVLCLMFSSNNSTWSEAADQCSRMGGQLVTLSTAEKRQRVASLSTTNSATSIWAGANDVREEGRWTWTDTFDDVSEGWGSSQPDGGTTENCLQFKVLSKTFNDKECYSLLPFVCEVVLK